MRLGRALSVLSTAASLGCAHGWAGGIHAVLRYRPATHQLLVEAVPAEGPSARAGLRAGDTITTIDGVPVDRLDEAGVRAALRGEVGTRVRLDARHDGEPARIVVIERAPYAR